MKGTWTIIKGILNRTQQSTSFPEYYFNINEQKITDKKVFANESNTFSQISVQI